MAGRALHAVAIEADQLLQQLCTEEGVAAFFLVGDDLQQDIPGDVLAGAFVDHDELHFVDH